MRCPNCGWPNKPNETTCVKCGSPLIDNEANTTPNGMSQQTPYGGTPQPLSNSGSSTTAYTGVTSSAPDESLRKTVMETDAFGPQRQTPEQATPDTGFPHATDQVIHPRQEKKCPKCGYPMRPDSNKCPNCNYIAGGQMEKTIYDVDAAPQRKLQRQPTRQTGAAAEPTNAKPAAPKEEVTSRGASHSQKSNAQKISRFSGTINPYLQGYEYIPTPTFSLKPLPREGEPKVPPMQTLEMEEATLMLNRDNTEPGNPTITSHEQAVVQHTDDGRWFIENRSKQGTTFVQANKRTELRDGDVLLLGNRLFEFKIVDQG